MRESDVVAELERQAAPQRFAEPEDARAIIGRPRPHGTIEQRRGHVREDVRVSDNEVLQRVRLPDPAVGRNRIEVFKRAEP